MFGSVDIFLIYLFLKTINGHPQDKNSEFAKFARNPPITDLHKIGRQADSKLQTLNLQDGENVQKLIPKEKLHFKDVGLYSKEDLGPEVPVIGGKKMKAGKNRQIAPQHVNEVQELTSQMWPMGVVPYLINKDIYDPTTVKRIGKAMSTIESVSCVVFRQLENKPEGSSDAWLYITNPRKERECVHQFSREAGGTELILGFDCLHLDEIIHSLLHGLGFRDEVTHPHRDLYIRVLWQNIQPKYRELFRIRHEDASYKLVEYDPMSIMHFHDRAFSDNGAATIAAMVPGLQLTSTSTLSQLDIMRLKLAFSHECNKRSIGDLLITCKNSLQPNNGVENESHDSESPGEVNEKVKPDNNNDSGVKGQEDGGDLLSSIEAVIEIEDDNDEGKTNKETPDNNKDPNYEKKEAKAVISSLEAVIEIEDDNDEGKTNKETPDNNNDPNYEKKEDDAVISSLKAGVNKKRPKGDKEAVNSHNSRIPTKFNFNNRIKNRG